MDKASDNALVKQCLNGNNEAFDILVKRYELPMYRTALRIVKNSDDAKDVTQNGFIKAWEKLSTYNSDHRFYSWLYRIIMNESLNECRRKKNTEQLKLVREKEKEQESIHNPVNDPRLQKLKEAIASLPEDQRLIIELKHFENLTYKEISEVLEIEVKTVKSRLFTARSKLGESAGES